MRPNQQEPKKQLPPQPKISSQFSQPISDMNANSFPSPLKKHPSLQLYGSKIALGDLHQQSMASLQSMESSESIISQSLDNQTFPIYYNDNIYMVNPVLTSNSSRKFKELVYPYMKEGQLLKNVRLNVTENVFTNRNMENFLKLCQNLPTDVNNDEMKEICEIAKMFQAEKIYNTGIKFIQSNMDASFSVPDSKYDESNGKRYLYITLTNKPDQNTESDDGKSVIYQLKIETRGLKCPIYRFLSNGKLLFSAKGKYTDVYIVDGSDIHIEKNKKNHIGQIHQHTEGYNLIRARDLKFKLIYVNSGKPNELSVEVDFPFKDDRIKWTPKMPIYDPVKDKYFLNFSGNYNRTAAKSSKNIVLQDCDGHATYISRKMEKDLFEVECHPAINPLIAFEIALSEIIGPYTC